MTNIRKLEQDELDHINASWRLDGDTIVWKRGRMFGIPVGTSSRKSGHLNVFLHFNKKLRGYSAARIIWFLRTGEYPSLHVEHKDCNPLNNSIENLRLATQSQNMANMYVGRTGNIKKGVYQNKISGKYYVQVQKDGIVHNRCGFLDFDSAYACRQSLAKELFGEFAR
jgi:hypothetical protein